MARWLEKLEEFTFSIEHRPGKKHLNADALSRLPEASYDDDDHPLEHQQPVNMVLCGKSHDELRTLQLEDDTIGLVLRAKESGNQLSKDDVAGRCHETRWLVQLWDQLVVSEGILRRVYWDDKHKTSFKQLVVPKTLRSDILKELHAGPGGGHLGVEKTLSKLKLRFYWPGHYKDTQDWCRACSNCATRKTGAPQNRAPLGSIPTGNPGQFVAVDIVGPFPEDSSGNKYILVVVDHFTKWGEAFPIPNQEALTVARVLCQEWFFRYSPPEGLHSDQGRQFESQLMHEICRILQIKKSCTSPYHPQCDGGAERFNRTLLNMLAIAAKNNTLCWASFIQPLCLAYNASVHATTGFSPFYLMFGREARLPVDLTFGSTSQETLSPNDYVHKLQKSLDYAYGLVRDTLGDVQMRQKTLYDKKVHGEPYVVGDRVWLYSSVVPKNSHRKLHHPWTGPYTISEKLSDVNYRIQLTSNPQKTSIVHFDRLKHCPFDMRLPGTTAPPLPQSPGETCNHHVGDMAELVDSEGTDMHNDEPADVPRYPQWQRRQPDWFSPYVSHY